MTTSRNPDKPDPGDKGDKPDVKVEVNTGDTEQQAPHEGPAPATPDPDDDSPKGRFNRGEISWAELQRLGGDQQQLDT